MTKCGRNLQTNPTQAGRGSALAALASPSKTAKCRPDSPVILTTAAGAKGARDAESRIEINAPLELTSAFVFKKTLLGNQRKEAMGKTGSPLRPAPRNRKESSPASTPEPNNPLSNTTFV